MTVFMCICTLLVQLSSAWAHLCGPAGLFGLLLLQLPPQQQDVLEQDVLLLLQLQDHSFGLPHVLLLGLQGLSQGLVVDLEAFLDGVAGLGHCEDKHSLIM